MFGVLSVLILITNIVNIVNNILYSKTYWIEIFHKFTLLQSIYLTHVTEFFVFYGNVSKSSEISIIFSKLGYA